MYIRKVVPGLSAAIIIALLAAGAAENAMAADMSAALSGNDALEQAVALYEKLQDEKVIVPESMKQGLDEHLLKSVVLGYVGLDEIEQVRDLSEIRKQDIMTILYKTIINYDSSYTITEEEADEILNECYDNAYIDEENRIAYAFMIRQGIIKTGTHSEPNKALNWESCRILVDLVYDYFLQDVTVTVNGTPITIGKNIESVLEVMGAPNRIDESDYEFSWYVYNADYENFVMIGVEGDRICALYTNSDNFEYNGVKSGDDMYKAGEIENENIKFTADEIGRVDSVMYNKRLAGKVYDNPEVDKNRGLELLDMINAYRVKHNQNIYVMNDELTEYALASLSDEGASRKKDVENICEADYDIYTIYEKLVQNESALLTKESRKNTSIGISSAAGSEDVCASIMLSEDTKTKRVIEYVDKSILPEFDAPDDKSEKKLFGIIPVANAEDENGEEAAAVVDTKMPKLEQIEPDRYGDGEDIVLSMEDRAANKYHLEVYDIEADDYLINSYISTDKKEIVIPAEILKNGLDYTVRLSAVAADGEELSTREQFISYGSAYDTGVKIVGPSEEEEYKSDSDYIALEWESELYSDFCIDVYNSSGEMILNTVVTDEKSACIEGLDPGEYHVYVTALRRGSSVAKAQDNISVTVKMPQPVTNEIILDRDDKYYFVYEDKELGILYFYDEEIIEVEENGETVKKKKVIQKQVKATKAYQNLAKSRAMVEYTTGNPVIRSQTSATGSAIAEEAKKYLGVPYVWGGSTPAGFDCSGLVYYVCASFGVDVPRVTYDQINCGVAVTRSELQPGDLIFFEKNGDIHHVGIYIGNNEFIHAPQTGDVVKITSLDNEYYSDQYHAARRVY